ncbi:MAG TPA: (2Fe-2S) ferredoxin domain-containing protein [Candidatus Hydrogenedentes bacterium]|nr:(2Fe-2S) ferredoxin domain-containing protein [Candidatus Hydrogenedentota bacterium]
MTTKITSPNDLAALRDKAREAIAVRTGPREITITVHMGTCGIAAGARDALAALAEALDQEGVKNVTLRQSGCAGLCDREPMITLTDKAGKEYRYGKLNSERILTIVQQHVVKGNPVMDYLIGK